MATVTDLPTPDFTFDPDAPGACVAGVRPYRTGSYRLDAEQIGAKFVVHNYGHGGAGITLSWGCAARVREIVRERVAASHDTKAAVIGAGVMGLTAASLLRDMGLAVTIYHDRKPLETTSAKAGGQWAVSVIEYAGKEREFAQIIRTAYTSFNDSIGKGFGVIERPNYTGERSHNLEVVRQLVPGLIPDPVVLPRLPFAHHAVPGFLYRTLLVEVPIFLARLEADLHARGVNFAPRRFAAKAEVLALPERIIVNCTGIGAKALWGDPKMVPIKGQLAMLPAQPALQYLWGQDGYMFPRSDYLVIGGTFERNVNNETVDKAACRGLVDHIRSVFSPGPTAPLPPNHIHHPDNAAVVQPTLPHG